jgi:hypothetical protein
MKMPNVKMRKIEVTSTKSVYLNGLRLTENEDYGWDGDKPKFAVPLKVGDHLVIGRELDGFEAFEVIPDHPEQTEREVMLGARMVFADWYSLIEATRLCPHKIAICDQPAMRMHGFMCPKTGDAWLIRKDDADKQKVNVTDDECRHAIINEHNSTIK